MSRALPEVCQEGRWLVVSLPETCRALSWALLRGGLTQARHVVWMQVTGAELRPPVDPVEHLRDALAEKSAAAGNPALTDAVAMMTSRRLDRHTVQREQEGEISAQAVVTLGLSNGVVVGAPATYRETPSTINMHCHVSVPLSDSALVEAVSLVAEARTAALLDSPWLDASGRPVTGTGTDCVVITCPLGGPAAVRPLGGSAAVRPLGDPAAGLSEPQIEKPVTYAGKHGEVGSVIGRAARRAVEIAYGQWREDREMGRLVRSPEASEGIR